MKKVVRAAKSGVLPKNRVVSAGKAHPKKKVNKKKAVGGETGVHPPASSTMATESLTPSDQQTATGQRKKRRSNNSRPFTRELPGLVMTSVSRGDQELVLSVVKTLGRFTVTDMVDDHSTHLVCGRGRRTINVLSATVRGCWVLSLDWVCQSLEAGRWLEEEKFEMTDCFPAAQYFREERGEVAGHLYRSSLFKEAGSVCVSPSTSPPSVQLEMLLVAGGANVTRSLRKADVCVGCHSPREGEEEGRAVSVTEAWILDSISSHQMLSYGAYILDKPQSRETSPEL